MAREAGIPLTIDDFDRVSRRTPLWADLKPGGRFTAVDLGRAGGTGVVAQRPVAAGARPRRAVPPAPRPVPPGGGRPPAAGAAGVGRRPARPPPPPAGARCPRAPPGAPP